ncbi:rhamnulokinase family protein [Actinomycetes bacterium KLBMP 9759]
MSTRTVAAVDLGAESGRVTTVRFDGERMHLDVVHRFAHEPRTVDGVLRWDLDRIWGGVRTGLDMIDGPVASVGVDAWGVDFGLLGADGALLDEPTCYRDTRQIEAMAAALAAVPRAELYGATGVQIIPINTIFALYADQRAHPQRLADARTLLMLPDVVHHLLAGSSTTEFTAASTSGAYDMATGRWATGLLDRLGIPTHFLPEVVAPGTDVGEARDLGGARVIVPPAHDTASAFVGTPVTEPGGLILSSGTWSLLGVETPAPVITEETQRANLTNEGGYGGTIRLLRNVVGLWLLQECRRQWARDGHDLDYGEIAELAAAQPGLVSVIPAEHEDFLAPGDMPARIRDFCARTGQAVPESIGAVARCVVDSLALSYRGVAADISDVTGTTLTSLNIVGGGSRHRGLSQLAADATGLPVRCGPVEATALGNAGVQLAALGELGGLDDIRAAVAASTDVVELEPAAGQDWAGATQLLAEITRGRD